LGGVLTISRRRRDARSARTIARISPTKSGKTHHPIVRFTGRDSDRVDGTVFEITDVELAASDEYEVAAYKRVAASLVSGSRAWVYVDARYACDAS
jgi:hypothetical protein